MHRLVNCDFLNASGFKVKLSNKAKLLYFMLLINADDRGFVDNALELANTLDQCEENFDNVLFQIKYTDAIQELVDKRLLFDFVDKVGNHVYLIRHWFFHNKFRNGLVTNYVTYLSRVELTSNKYQIKLGKDKDYKDSEDSNKINQNKLKQNKPNEETEINIVNKDKESDSSENWEDKWDSLINSLDTNKGEK